MTTSRECPGQSPDVTLRREGAVATLVVDRPPANAVTPGVIDQFLELISGLESDPTIRCVVIRGTGRFFVAGADIAVMRDLSERNQLAMRRWIDVQRRLELLAKPVIAALNGHTLGGGAELSLACDLRIMAESATFGFPEMRLGLFPGAGGSQRLPRLIGQHRAKLLMIEGTRLDAHEALAHGLVDEVVADAGFDSAVAERAARWAGKPTATIGELKRVVDAGYGVPIERGLDHEYDGVMRLIKTADAAEGLQAFLDKREADFRGR